MSVAIKACVIGDPIEHSLSPVLHGFWLKQYGINGTYTSQRVAENELAAFFRSLAPSGYAGCNITLPHKEAALQYMDELSDVAKKAGAINTVVVRPDGALYGTNTDVHGFRQSMIATAGVQACLKKRALVVGAGGAARGICLALQEMECVVSITNRTRAKAEDIAKTLGNISVINWDKKEEELSQTDILVNATSLGLAGKDPLVLSLDRLPLNAVVSDIVYRPLYTPLLRDAQQRGHAVVTGIGMLLYQAQPGFEYWFGVKPEVNTALEQHVLKGIA